MMQEMSRQGSFVLCQAAYMRRVRIWLMLARSSAIYVLRRKVSREKGNKLFHIGVQRKESRKSDLSLVFWMAT